jgi:hypothetical protein
VVVGGGLEYSKSCRRHHWENSCSLTKCLRRCSETTPPPIRNLEIKERRMCGAVPAVGFRERRLEVASAWHSLSTALTKTTSSFENGAVQRRQTAAFACAP